MGFDPGLSWRLAANGGHLDPQHLFPGGWTGTTPWVPLLAGAFLLTSPLVLLAAVVWLYRPPPRCPRCGAPMRGLLPSLLRGEVLRHSCPACGRVVCREGTGIETF